MLTCIKGTTRYIFMCMYTQVYAHQIHLTAGWNTYTHTQYVLLHLSMNLSHGIIK